MNHLHVANLPVFYATGAMTQINSFDVRITFNRVDAMDMARRVQNAQSPQAKQAEQVKGMDVLPLCEVIMSEKAAHELLKALKNVIERKDLSDQFEPDEH